MALSSKCLYENAGIATLIQEPIQFSVQILKEIQKGHKNARSIGKI